MTSHLVIHPCDGRSKSEIQAFECIVAGAPPMCAAKAIEKLLNAGLIERHDVVVGADRFGPIVKHEYFVPVNVHFQWCEYTSRPRVRRPPTRQPTQEPPDSLPLFEPR